MKINWDEIPPQVTRIVFSKFNGDIYGEWQDEHNLWEIMGLDLDVDTSGMKLPYQISRQSR